MLNLQNYVSFDCKPCNKLTAWSSKVIAIVWNIVIHNNESGTMTLLPTMSQYYTTQSWYTPVVSTGVVQNLYAHKTATTFPLKYGSNAQWSLTKGCVTALLEETTYTTTTVHNDILFFLWNIGHEHDSTQ
jgi:hypothetical protein